MPISEPETRATYDVPRTQHRAGTPHWTARAEFGQEWSSGDHWFILVSGQGGSDISVMSSMDYVAA